MPAKKKNLSAFDTVSFTAPEKMRIGVLVSRWNQDITGALLDGAMKTLLQHGVKKDHIYVHYVPGSFELTAGANIMAGSLEPHAIICLGCIVQGETRHFEFIAQSVANGIAQVSIARNIPVIFGVLTTDTIDQALERSGGKHGNKGVEAAMTAMHMAELWRELNEVPDDLSG